MSGNEGGAQQKPEIASESLQPELNVQAVSAAPLGDATCVGQNVESNTATKDTIEDPQEVNSEGAIKLPEERDQLAHLGIATCVNQNVQSSTARDDTVQDVEEVYSAGAVKLQEERDQFTPLGDTTCVDQNVQSTPARKGTLQDTDEVQYAGAIQQQEERDRLASDGPSIMEAEHVENERLHDPSEDGTKNSPLEDIIPLPPEGLEGSNATGNSSHLIFTKLNQNSGCSENPSKSLHESGLGLVEVEVTQNFTDPLISLLEVTVEPVFEGLEIYPEDGANCLVTEQFELPVEVISDLDHLETAAGKPPKNFDRSGRGNKKNTTTVKKKYILRSSAGNKGAQQSMVDETPKVLDSNDQAGDATALEESKLTRRKKMRTRKAAADEYSKIRKNLSYMLKRIGYERSLIDAYSSEGWRGLSLEKLKPEKELQRATSEIVRRKLRIRDLFQHLDSLCAEGALPESLFDEEGMIDSEDIFCSKCGSKELTLNNDIILCDGACDRGFHQFCLDPPLRKEDIPPGDEGWLCPGCDCKLDCLDMLNESQGTKIRLKDSWEKVFPEAVKAGNQDPTSGLSSDDSEDEDFDPDRPQTHGKVHSDESSSSESEYATASDNSEPQPKDRYLGLPSDDSEDDDFDPDAPNPDKVKEESSSSDFTSDSEDLEAALVVDDDLHGSNGVLSKPSSAKGRKGPKSKGGRKKQGRNDELHSLLESEPGENGADDHHVSARRLVQRLDYKKLHDETYGGTTSDSSDDEDWNDTPSPRKRKRSDDDENQQKEETDSSITKSKSRGKRKSEGAKTPVSAKSTGSENQSSSSRRLSEDVKKRLHEAFTLNHFPDRATKDALAAELGVTYQQVDKWFGNARWSFNHPEGRQRNVLGRDVKKNTTHSPRAVTKSNTEELSNGSQQKEDESGKNVVEQSESPEKGKKSPLGKEKGKAGETTPAGQSSRAKTRRRSLS